MYFRTHSLTSNNGEDIQTHAQKRTRTYAYTLAFVHASRALSRSKSDTQSKYLSISNKAQRVATIQHARQPHFPGSIRGWRRRHLCRVGGACGPAKRRLANLKPYSPVVVAGTHHHHVALVHIDGRVEDADVLAPVVAPPFPCRWRQVSMLIASPVSLAACLSVGRSGSLLPLLRHSKRCLRDGKCMRVYVCMCVYVSFAHSQERERVGFRL